MNQSKQDLYKLLGILGVRHHEAIEHMHTVDEIMPLSEKSQADLAIAQQTVVEISRQILETAWTMKASNESA